MNEIASLWHRPRVSSWWDVADILIVAFLIYQALMLIRGTRAMQMAIGLLFVLLLLYASQHMPLQTVNWLIRNVLMYAVIAAIVLFQADIRRALSHLGRAPFFRYLARSGQVAEIIEEIVTAADLLAKADVGAIIVYEREIGLRKALGAQKGDIMFQFLIEAVLICLFGGTIGILFGTGVSWLLSTLAQWTVYVSMGSIILSFTFSVLVGLIFGVWPAWRAAKMLPIEALRYE